MDLLEEIVDLIIVRPSACPAMPGMHEIEFPSTRRVARLWKDLGVRAPVPQPEDPIWDQVNARFKQRFKALKEMAPKLHSHSAGAGISPDVPQADVWIKNGDGVWVKEQPAPRPAPISAHPAARNASPKNARQGVQAETRLTTMKGAEALVLCKTLGLNVEPHPTNPGITAMRAKNKLAFHLRQGGALPE